MIGVTFFGVFLTPVFYIVIRWLTGERSRRTETIAERRSSLEAKADLRAVPRKYRG
jgi:hypothetical protein